MIGVFGYGYIGKNLNENKVNIENISQCDKLYFLAGESEPGLEWSKYLCNIELCLEVVKRTRPECEIVFTSTVKVFDSYNRVNPQDSYAKSKKICEDVLLERGNCQILRLANVISKDISYGSFYSLLKQAKEGHVKFYKGSYRPFITMGQAVEGIKMEKPPGVYNLSCSAIYTEDIIKLLAQKYKFTTESLKGEPIQLEPRYSEMKELGWNSKTSRENIEEVLCSL